MSYQGKSILVVDDEPMIAEDLCESLEESGYKVFLPSHSGVDAIRQVQQGEPDLVLMDINLKGDLDGISTAQAIQKIHDCAIIYLTANADSQTLQRAKMTSPFGYIIKPFRERELHALVEISLYKHAQEKRARVRQNLFLQTLQNTPDAILVLNHQQQIQFMNPSAEKLLALAFETIQGHNLDDVLYFSWPESGERVIELAQIEALTPLVLHRADQSHCHVRVYTSALHDLHGHFQGRMLHLYLDHSLHVDTGPLRGTQSGNELLTVCAACKQIRNPDGSFSSFEVFFRQYYQMRFSHGVCPPCFEQLYPDYLEKLKH
ncbi:MAG: response regulator [Candidatus Sericytochromatia bacterium]|nr:response regulator [Candidatus Sericytochromatia bacterium]